MWDMFHFCWPGAFTVCLFPSDCGSQVLPAMAVLHMLFTSILLTACMMEKGSIVAGTLACSDLPGLCGSDEQAICSDAATGPLCSCPRGYIPTPRIDWDNTTTCRSLDEQFHEFCGGQNGYGCFLSYLIKIIDNITSLVLPVQTVSILLDNLVNQSQHSPSTQNDVVQCIEKLLSTLVEPTNFTRSYMELNVVTINPNASLNTYLHTSDALLEVNLITMTMMNAGMASVALVTYEKADSDYLAYYEQLSKMVTVAMTLTTENLQDNPFTLTIKHLAEIEDMDQTFCAQWNNGYWSQICATKYSNSTHTVLDQC
ncbi:uncharacterized protein LOC114785817 [Denticeps clupeoides]|uniref:uncharacterized protein LOC114785816 n=1 Tax=Denticeps clupeoides TaxID=299321 RepID=UPI0010A5314D|nr:uncharacterized protein LOC114785816 [Denticeps clupeoides]XP_028828274.1 uncharacterized protein LOC114785817 [Denticeps clupeoides]